MKYLIVVDMQNDFIDGALGSKDAQNIVDNVCEKIKNYDGKLYLTKDTHWKTKYNDTLEGKLLPVPHCLIDENGVPTTGWEFDKRINEAIAVYEKRTGNKHIEIKKPTFGSTKLIDFLKEANTTKVNNVYVTKKVDEIEVCGLCTDICVVSNALMIRANFPDTPMKVDSKACAGVTPAKHEAALEVMRSCQIEVI